ncbi:DUF2207 family protein [Alteribacter natronophilus]|uniref:DUF2207 family protein n=1 Tax=Alteribacter natronophilus TaxID=2583810 RepID=UPI0014861C56|nr:DUF2207 domain-containing protein [Alteribacter natronophilus]
MIITGWILFALITGLTVTVLKMEKMKKADPFSFEGEKEKLLQSLEKTRLSPAMTVKLMSRRGLSSNDVTAGLLHLALKGAVRLEYDNSADNHSFVERKKELPGEPLTEDEQFLLEWLLYRVGSNGVFRIGDLARYTDDKGKMEQYLHDLYTWEQRTVSSLKAFNLYRPLGLPRMLVLAGGAVGTLAGSVLVFFQPFTGAAVFLAGLAGLAAIYFVSPHTAAGRMEESRWRSYYQLLSSEEAGRLDREHLSLSFIYAIAFKVLDRFYTAFPVREADELKVNEEPFPLYYFAPAGSVVLSAEGVRMYEELEQSFDRVENAPVAMGDSDLPDGLD